MKIKNLFWTGVFCLSLATVALADGDTPIGNLTGDTPIGNLIAQVITMVTGG